MSYETYYERYKELCDTYKIKYGTYGLVPNADKLSLIESRDAFEAALKEYDVVVDRVGGGYAHTKYRVIRNAPGLSSKDLAIICDYGNLCFGYRVEGSIICIYTD